MRRERLTEVLLILAAPALALGLGLAVAGLVLAATGADPVRVAREVVAYGTTAASAVATLDRAVPYLLAGLAAAVAFRAGLFTIGIDGQYRLAAFTAAVVGGAVALPAPLHLGLMVAVAMLVGAGWAAIAGVLAAYRGVSVVIGTIMLNAIATGLIAWLLDPSLLGFRAPGSNDLTTAPIPDSGRLAAIATPAGAVDAFLVPAIAVAIGVWLLLGRTTYGFDLRAMGRSVRAAQVSGVAARRTIVVTMAVSGAIAGLVGLPDLLGSSHAYGLGFPPGLGWTGISIAILGRNHPSGIALGALLWAWLERSAQVLDLLGVPREVVTIMQAVIVLAVVVAWEVVRRSIRRRQQRLVGGADDGRAGDPRDGDGTAADEAPLPMASRP